MQNICTFHVNTIYITYHIIYTTCNKNFVQIDIKPYLISNIISCIFLKSSSFNDPILRFKDCIIGLLATAFANMGSALCTSCICWLLIISANCFGSESIFLISDICAGVGGGNASDVPPAVAALMGGVRGLQLLLFGKEKCLFFLECLFCLPTDDETSFDLHIGLSDAIHSLQRLCDLFYRLRVSRFINYYKEMKRDCNFC